MATPVWPPDGLTDLSPGDVLPASKVDEVDNALQYLYERSADWVGVSDTWTYNSSDDPVFTVTVPAGALTRYSAGFKVRLKQGGSFLYFIVVALTDTQLTLYGGTDYDLADAAITDVSVSAARIPFGFPGDPAKWTVSLTDTADRTQASPSGTTWYNLGALSITIPIGAWHVDYRAACEIVDAGGQIGILSTLSTTNNSQTDAELTSALRVAGSPANATATLTAIKDLLLAAKTVYYLNARSNGGGTSLTFYGSTMHPTIVRAVSAYL